MKHVVIAGAFAALLIAAASPSAHAQQQTACTAVITKGKGANYTVTSAYSSIPDGIETKHTFSVTGGTPNGSFSLSWDYLTEVNGEQSIGAYPFTPGVTYGPAEYDDTGKWGGFQEFTGMVGPTYPYMSKSYSIKVVSNIATPAVPNKHAEDTGTATITYTP